MTPTEIDNKLVGAWHTHLTFTEGPRRGEHEQVRLTFLPDGLIVGAGETPADRGSAPPAAGEWSAEGDRFSYWLNAVLTDPSGRPRTVVHAHAQGTLAADGRTLTASGGSETYGSGGELLGANRADGHATRTEAA